MSAFLFLSLDRCHLIRDGGKCGIFTQTRLPIDADPFDLSRRLSIRFVVD